MKIDTNVATTMSFHIINHMQFHCNDSGLIILSFPICPATDVQIKNTFPLTLFTIFRLETELGTSSE